MSSSSTTSGPDSLKLDFAHAVPPPLNALLLQLAPAIAALRRLFDVLNWKKGHRLESWLLVASWWAFCILGPFAIKYALPILVLVPAAFVVSPRKHKHNPELSTEDTFQSTLSNLLVVESSFELPSFSLPSLPPLSFLRVIASCLPPYWILTRLLGVKVVVASIGTLGICWRASWARRLSAILWKSAWFRIGIAYIWSLMTGLPRPRTPMSANTIKTGAKENTTELRLLFTVIENQRWWMGLDWTAALLPAERPSWSTNNLQPVSPPNSFTLPDQSISYIPHPEKPKFRVQRRATWRWEDPEWKVVVIKNDTGSPPPPLSRKSTAKSISSPSREASTSEQPTVDSSTYDRTKRLSLNDRLKGKMVEGSRTSLDLQEEEKNIVSSSEDEPVVKQSLHTGKKFTDTDGWIYGDNKWENLSDKGGMGKYTRFRRWTRVAVLREESEEVGPGFTGVVRSAPAQTIVSTDTTSPTTSNKEPITGSATSSPIPSPSESSFGATDRLRQRLQAAIRRESTSS